MVGKNYKTLKLTPKYVPKKSEKYMSVEQKAYFYQLLLSQREELLQNSDSVLNAVRTAEITKSEIVGDESDNSNFEQTIAMNLKMSQRNSNLLKKIDTALERLENGTFGYSIISGDEIGISRMLARPLATVTIEEQEELEKKGL